MASDGNHDIAARGLAKRCHDASDQVCAGRATPPPRSGKGWTTTELSAG